MRKSAVNVFASGTLSGAISRSSIEADTFLFGYAPDCPPDATVSLTMPVVADQYDSMGTVHPIFEMNLPEGMLRQRLELTFAKLVPDFDALSLLEIVGRSQIGRLRYAPSGAALEDVPVQDVGALLAYQGADDLFGALLERFAPYSGVSGVQPKVLVRDEQGPLDRITHRGATHIVKSFDPDEYPELAANEFFCMRAARHAGLPTARVQLSANRRILVVERFDRNPAGGYLGFEDFCVLSGMRASGRYHSSYEAIAGKIRQFVSPQRQAGSMLQFFASVALACAIRNGDAHLKNFAILYDDSTADVRLAPVYDMLSTTPYQPQDVLALTLDGSKSWPTPRQLADFGRYACGLSKRAMAESLRQVARGIETATEEMRAYRDEHPDFGPAAGHLENIFRNGVRELLNAPQR